MRASSGIAGVYGPVSVKSAGARVETWPWYGPFSGDVRRGRTETFALNRPPSVGIHNGGAKASLFCCTGLHRPTVLRSKCNEWTCERRQDLLNYAMMPSRHFVKLLQKRDTSAILPLNRIVRLTIKSSQIKDTRRALNRLVKYPLRILRTFQSGLSWSLLPVAVVGGGVVFSNGQTRADEKDLCNHYSPVKRRGLAIFISSALIALLLVSGITDHVQQPAFALTQENLVFLEAWRTVDRAYVDKSFNGQSWFRYREDALRQEPMRTREETYDAIRKMLATLDDPFTRFLEPEKFKALKSGTNGALTGVGLEVGFDVSAGGTSEDLVVVSPILGGPAGRAGIVPGDVILAIDGVPTRGMGLYDAARRLQGPLNSQVELTLLDKSSTMPKTVTVLREKVTVNPVTWKLCDLSSADENPTKLGYIRLSTFNQNSSRAVKDAIKSLRNSGATSFVLDIRNNSGGLFPAGVEIAKMWLESGVIVYITDSLGVRDIYETDGEGAVATKEPLTVLVNKGTASASEILAGALKDNKRAVIVGESTFGKGRIQSVFALSDGSGMAVTVARYETPAHINIDKVGITPDRPLSPEVLPMEEESLCSFLRDSSSPIHGPKLF